MSWQPAAVVTLTAHESRRRPSRISPIGQAYSEAEARSDWSTIQLFESQMPKRSSNALPTHDGESKGERSRSKRSLEATGQSLDDAVALIWLRMARQKTRRGSGFCTHTCTSGLEHD